MNPNYIYNKGDLLVAPGGGGAFTPLQVGPASYVLSTNPNAELGVNWIPNSNNPQVQNLSIVSSLIDFTNPPDTLLLYTPPVSTIFIPTTFNLIITNFTDDVDQKYQFTYGTQNTGYTNYIVSTNVTVVDPAPNTKNLGVGLTNTSIVNSNPFGVSTIEPAIATTQMGYFILQGYLFNL